MNNIEEYTGKTFEEIKKSNEYGGEYWLARELAPVLEYAQWRNFVVVIEKAKTACETSGNSIADHFADVSKMVGIGSDAMRSIDDVMLSRYACYLIVQNADPRKETVALGQTYFAIKTRERELQENFDEFSEEQKRLAIRTELKTHNKHLADAAKGAGVATPLEYAVFQNYGYMGLYGGLKAQEIHKHKKLKKNQSILDHMGSTELAANLFRATQTEEKLKRDKISGKQAANNTHFTVGSKVRQTIAELDGAMPEDLPTPDKSVKEIENSLKKLKQ